MPPQLFAQVTVICTLGAVVFSCSRPLGPAVRHKLCALTLALSVLAPLASLLPTVHKPLVLKVSAALNPAPGWARSPVLAGYEFIWLAGAALVLLHFLCGNLLVWMKVRGLNSGDKWHGICVRLGPVSTPFVWGWFRPVIVLPQEAAGWTEERRQLALTHEMAHVKRRDNWVLLAAIAARSLYWFHPLVWWLSIKLRGQQELACDERVLAGGAEPAAYAEFLLDVSRRLTSAALFSCAMASDSESLRGRIMNILNFQPNGGRSFLNRFARVVLPVLLVAATAALPGVKLGTLSAATNGQVYKMGGDVTSPKVLYKIEPEYSKNAKDAKIEGTTLLSLVIDSAGLPGDIKVIRSLEPSLDQAAMDAVSRWRFQPGTKAGTPVAVEAHIEVNFKLK